MEQSPANTTAQQDSAGAGTSDDKSKSNVESATTTSSTAGGTGGQSQEGSSTIHTKNPTACTIPKTELMRKLNEMNPSSPEFSAVFRKEGNKVVCAICGHYPFKHPQGSASRRTLSNNLRAVATGNATTTTPTSAPIGGTTDIAGTPATPSLQTRTPPPTTAYGNNSEDAARDWEKQVAAEKEKEREEKEFRSRSSLPEERDEEPQIPEYNSSSNLVISPRPMQPHQQPYGSQGNLNSSQVFRQASTNSSIFGGGLGNSFPSRGATPQGGGGTFPRVDSASENSPSQQPFYHSGGSLPSSATNRVAGGGGSGSGYNSRGEGSAMPVNLMMDTPRSGLAASRSPPRPQSMSGSQDPGPSYLTREITRQYTSDIATAPHMAGSMLSPTTGGAGSTRGSPRPQPANGSVVESHGLPPLPHSDSNRTTGGGSTPNSAPKRVMRPPTIAPSSEVIVQDEGITRGAHLERPLDTAGDSPNSPALPTFPTPSAAVAAAGGRSEAPVRRDPSLGQQYCPDQHRVPPTGMNVERDRSFDPLPGTYSRFKKTTRAPLTWKKARRQRCASFTLLLLGFVTIWSCIVFIPWLMTADRQDVAQASKQLTGDTFGSARYPLVGIAIGAGILSLFMNIYGARLTETGQFILYAAASVRPYDLTNAVKTRGPKLFWTPLPLNPWTNEAYSPLVAANQAAPGRLGGQLGGDTRGIPAGQLSMPMRNLKEVYPEVNRRDQLINERYQRPPSPNATFPEFPTYHVWDDQSTGFVEVTDGTDFSDKLGFRVSICRELCFADDLTKMLYESEFSAYYRQVAARAPPLKNLQRSRSRSVTPRAPSDRVVDAQTHLLSGGGVVAQQYSIQQGTTNSDGGAGGEYIIDDEDTRELVEEDYSLEGISDQTIWGWLDDANKGGFLLSELGMYLFAILGLFPLIIYFKSHRIGAATLMSRKVIKKIVPR